MAENTPRFGLPYILPGQAQKEITHNEALATLDACVSASVVAVGLNPPPPAPLPGEAWIVGPSPTGDWAGKANMLASFSEGGWRFLAPLPGMMVWSQSNAVHATWNGSSWSLGAFPVSGLIVQGQPMLVAARPSIAEPAGGATVDTQARSALTAMLQALRAHGLILS